MRTKKRLSRNRVALADGLFAGAMAVQADTVLWDCPLPRGSAFILR